MVRKRRIKNPLIGRQGTKIWYNENDQLHRTGGPAIEYSNGDKEWYLDGIKYPKEAYINEILRQTGKLLNT